MNGEELKAKANAGGVVYGMMLSASRSPRWAAPIGALGLDYIIIDTEHAPRGRGDVADLLVGLNATGVVPIVRVPVPQSHQVTMALDAGAQGVLVPYCETVEEVREVVGAAKWRPLKGALVDGVMLHGEFPSDATRAYLENRNRNTVCIIGIESVPAMMNLEAILAVPGVDAIFVGPNDLSISLGVPDQYDHPRYEEALRKIIAACQRHGVPVLIHHQTVALSQKWLAEGARWVLHSTDVRAVHNAVRAEFGALREAAEALGAGPAAALGESDEKI